MLFYANLCKLGLYEVLKSQWNNFHGVKSLGIATKITSFGELTEKSIL